MKRLILTITAAFASLMLFAQDPTGGVKGTVVNRNGRVPVENARLVLKSGAADVATVTSAQDGTFLIPGLPDGNYTLVIDAPDFLQNQVQVTVQDGYVKNMFNLSLTGVERVNEADEDNFAALDMEDSGYNDNPTILFGSNDVFNSIAGYNFSSVRFRARGYNSESQDVYLAGIKLNDAITGYSPYSLWSGLNEATRSKESVNGAETADFGFGGYNGATNIFGTASEVRKGFRVSALTNSSLYRLRVMASYATGMMDNGWSFAANVSARLGGNDWIKGVYYRSLSYYLAADKKINDQNTLSFVFFAAPGERGAQMASTQEVYDLVGDNMYNSNWGYQNGKVRNLQSGRSPLQTKWRAALPPCSVLGATAIRRWTGTTHRIPARTTTATCPVTIMAPSTAYMSRTSTATIRTNIWRPTMCGAMPICIRSSPRLTGTACTRLTTIQTTTVPSMCRKSAARTSGT